MLLQDFRHIFRLGWPIFIGQLAVMAFSIIDTALVAHVSSTDLAALALSSSIYISVYISLMGILQALIPVAAQLHGAGKQQLIGEEVRQSAWLALGLSTAGMTILLFPFPILSITHADLTLQLEAAKYLHILAFGLPASLFFRVYSSLNNAISRPTMVTALQLGGLLLKIPLSAWLIFGGFGLPAQGGVGSAIASVCIYWLWCLCAFLLLRYHASYQPFLLFSRFSPPSAQKLTAQLKLGLPMGFSYLIEVTAFAFMALFIARLGNVPLAGHQIAANLGATLYMIPLSLAIATSTLVAQALGAQHYGQAHRIGWNGVKCAGLLAAATALLLLLCRLPLIQAYTPDTQIQHAALPLLRFIAFYQIFDALQVMAGFVLRAYKVTLIPMGMYALSLWGVGLGGGYLLGFNAGGHIPSMITGAAGFWLGNSISLAIAAICLLSYLHWISQYFLRNNRS